MAWLDREKPKVHPGQKKDTPSGLWKKCTHCHEVIFKKDFIMNQWVCPKCSFHYPLPSLQRIQGFLDGDSFKELDKDLVSNDPLQFSDSKTYKERLDIAFKKTGHKDAILTGRGKLHGKHVQLGIFNFDFMGGSMGSVVGQKITNLFERAAKKKEPAIIVTASGGARMQEGIVSLMQMARTCAALTQLRENGVPFISILAHPTTGGVAASFAMLGDVNIAEPGALIGFAGPRVIEQTIGETLPEGFQRSEYLLEHGMVDMICHRDSLRLRVSQILAILAAKLPQYAQS